MSCTPGAEGAEVSSEVCVGWALLGTNRRDYRLVNTACRDNTLVFNKKHTMLKDWSRSACAESSLLDVYRRNVRSKSSTKRLPWSLSYGVVLYSEWDVKLYAGMQL